VRRSALATLCASALLLTTQPPASALDTTGTPTPVTGSATWFDNLGSPYGGCGLPQNELDSPHFVALNVFNTPGDYQFYDRPLAGADLSKMGLWNNGHNCGRWIRVKISDYCTGTNDGARNQPFCRNGSWVADAYNDAELNMIIADSCGDDNAWCRDDPYHIDLAHASLNQFVKDGAPVGDMDPQHWGNRHVTWEFIPAPDYSGDIRIGFLQGAQTWWTAIAVSHLENGVHGVEYYADGAWAEAEMNGDMGQSFIIKPLVQAGTDYRIRVRDIEDELINDAREYEFSLPASCTNQCSAAYTEVPYTTSDGETGGDVDAPAQDADAGASGASVSSSDPVPAKGSAPACQATYTRTGQWSGGFQGEVRVTAGNRQISNWTVGLVFADGQAVTQAWNVGTSTAGSTVTARSAGYNGGLAANTSTAFGLLGNWDRSTSAPEVTCTAS
jgi:hypothetical protein